MTTVDLMRSDSHVEKMKRWLSPPDTSTNSNKARESRHEGTGTWFLESAAFKEWKLGSRQHLWLHGLPGCGKTVLSATVLDHLAQQDEFVTIDFFFDFSDAAKQKPDDMCRSLAFQLYTRRAETMKALDSLLASHDDGRTQPTTDTLAKCLQAMLRVSGKLCILLDALDECAQRAELLRWMESFTSNSTFAHIQLLATGRPEEEFVRGFRDWISEQNCIVLDKEAINADIQAYIGARLERKEFSKWTSSSVLQKIKEEVGGKADGMFRWAACQLDSLETCLDREELENTLMTLPRDLNATYERILESIPQNRKTKATRLLQFLVYSDRPLTLQEAVDVIAVRLDERKYFDPDDRLPDPADITRFCPSLVVLAATLDEDDIETFYLQLAHFSVKEYLLQHDVEGFRGIEPRVIITQTCLSYLASVDSSYKDDIKFRFPLANHAANVWFEHARLAESSEEVVMASINFLRSATAFDVWVKLFYKWRHRLHVGGPFYQACAVGLTAAVQRLLLIVLNVNDQNGYDGSALQAASAGGYEGIVQLLLDKGADVNANAQGGKVGNALQAASYRGHEGVVQLLLDKGADVNAQGGLYSNALQAASAGGYEGIIQLLLDKGADVNAQGGYYIRGYEGIVQLLLDKGADVNAQGGRYGSALEAASAGGYKGVVQLLLNKGADANAQGGDYGNALQAASAEGYEGIVQLLLDKGADVNAQSGDYGNALQAASVGGYKGVVQLLLDKGADANAQGGYYSNALQAASAGGYEGVVQLLLERGADITATDSDGWTPLHSASRRGHVKVIELLLEEFGACANSMDKDGRNALFYAAMQGNSAITRLLLSSGAMVNTKDRYNATPLIVASRNGHKNAVEVLLEAEDDCIVLGKEVWTH
ncbi:Ankyrin repeat domain-containing protein 50-like protein 2 [Colletotrichum chlorophyti]|uniref:Ankyrin repeat domain-containing protein 50-like protein 2 n=1 Tax=Colletotrichum chlorophyti TaxID=708187 RepID=A0A1Q8RPI5_9PEZI|nr:Ankyrin repeat domain-containing protein 50-like protein 2 [Colletotrichum chlorophyti]